MSWLEAFKIALEMHWPAPDQRPDGIEELRRVAGSVPFTAPEMLAHPARRAWAVYQHEGDTEVGRAAVALTYVIQCERDEVEQRC